MGTLIAICQGNYYHTIYQYLANLQFPISAESQLNGTAALISGLIQILRTDYESLHNFYSIAVLHISVAVK